MRARSVLLLAFALASRLLAGDAAPPESQPAFTVIKPARVINPADVTVLENVAFVMKGGVIDKNRLTSDPVWQFQ